MIFFKNKRFIFNPANFLMKSDDWLILDINGKYPPVTFELSRRIQLTRTDGVLHDYWLKHDVEFRNSLNHKYQFSKNDYVSLWNSSHAMIRSMIESFKNELHEIKGAGLDLAQEDQALKWLQVTILNLQKAIDHCLITNEKFAEATLFIGKRSKDAPKIIRLLIFNLDFVFQFEGERGVAVLVYDDSQKTSRPPEGLILQTYFKQLHLPLYDQIIELLKGFGRLWNEPLQK